MEKKIKISSKPENIWFIERLVDNLCDEGNISNELYGKILMATIEGVNNSIFHGNKLDEAKKVVVKIMNDNDCIDVVIEDEGEGFDVNIIPDPTSPDNIEEMHGRGIFLMNNLADEIFYYNSGKQIEMRFLIMK
ncbi:MAG: ATP-binding protein [Bacteroidales bacterium]|nr:ATP-binding protein [Bacteroidales bacterium]